MEVKLRNQLGLTDGIYYKASENGDFVLASESFNPNIEYYSHNRKENLYKREYTLQQIKTAHEFYHTNNKNIYTIEHLSSVPKTHFSAHVCLHVVERDSNSQIVKETAYQVLNPQTFEQTESGKPKTIQIEHDKEIYTVSYTTNTTTIKSLSNMTRGQFWYNYHNYLSQPALVTEAAVIETQLSTY